MATANDLSHSSISQIPVQTWKQSESGLDERRLSWLFLLHLRLQSNLENKPQSRWYCGAFIFVCLHKDKYGKRDLPSCSGWDSICLCIQSILQISENKQIEAQSLHCSDIHQVNAPHYTCSCDVSIITGWIIIAKWLHSFPSFFLHRYLFSELYRPIRSIWRMETHWKHNEKTVIKQNNVNS